MTDIEKLKEMKRQLSTTTSVYKRNDLIKGINRLQKKIRRETYVRRSK